MAITLEEISTLLNEIDFAHKVDTEDDMILSGGGSSENRLAFIIQARDEGKIFEMEGRLMDDEMNIVSAKDHEHLPTLLPFLLQRNYETKFGTWEFSPANGTIRIMVEMPLEDNTMTKAQMERIVNFMMSCEEEAGQIKHILKTGEVPEDNSDEMMKMMLEMLEKMSKELEAKKAADEDEGI